MRYLFLKAAISIIILAAFFQASFGGEDFTPSQLQFSFAEYIKSIVPGIEDAKWKSHVDLWVQAPDADKNKANDIAADVIAQGKTDSGQDLCVHVHNGDWKELSKLCWSY